MGWRVARSLDQLLAQINTAYPDRSKAADGSIGDAAHAASVSDHNPDQYGVVRARDYTHDPDHGFDAHAMADALVASRDPRIKYVISRGRIASSTVSPWVWRTYTGTNRHDHHAHVSVVPDARADDTRPWAITQHQEEDDMTPQQAKQLDELHRRVYGIFPQRYGVTRDGVWSQTTEGAPDAEPARGLDEGHGNVIVREIRKAAAALAGLTPATLAAAVVAQLPPDQVDVDALAKAIVLELGKD